MKVLTVTAIISINVLNVRIIYVERNVDHFILFCEAFGKERKKKWEDKFIFSLSYKTSLVFKQKKSDTNLYLAPA